MKRRREVSVTFANGQQIQTEINGTEDEIIAYYKENTFNVGKGGEDDVQSVVEVKFLDTQSSDCAGDHLPAPGMS